MRVCGSFQPRGLRRRGKGVRPDRFARERVGAALFAIDHAESRPAGQSCLPHGADGGHGGAAARDHVLDVRQTSSPRRSRLRGAARCRSPSAPCGRSRTEDRTQARRRPSAPRRAESGPARRVASGATSRAREPSRSPSSRRSSGCVRNRYLSRQYDDRRPRAQDEALPGELARGSETRARRPSLPRRREDAAGDGADALSFPEPAAKDTIEPSA